VPKNKKDDPELGSIESTLDLTYAELPVLLRFSLNKGGINPYAVAGLNFPGLFVEDHEVFMEKGGWFEWEFVTLLVCKEAVGSAEHYLANGTVRAKTRFVIRRTYPGSNKPPTVKGKMLKGKPEGKREYYDPCRDMAEVLRETELLAPFKNPRPH
jgi:hypothetical protein